MSASRPFLTARWHHLVMLNYPIAPDLLRSYVPRGTQLDQYDGMTYISMVGFLFDQTRLAGCSLPGHRTFEEVNLRFYVRREVAGVMRRGVVLCA
jgi:uncharacterized protein YqjF (DUF2071 family)